MDEPPRVDILIVTLCAANRAAAIRRAIATTLAQNRVCANLIIVVNGERYDAGLFAALARESRVRVLYQKEASIFRARRCAREHVTAPFFGFLDDDDYLLPGALRARVEALLTDATTDAVVANGYLSDGTAESPMLRDVDAIRNDPLRSLMRSNWLATASALFRTATVSPDYFDPTILSIDMTYLAFRLALERKVAFIDAPTYRKTCSPDSISLTDEWALPALATLSKMLAFDMPSSVRRSLRRKCTRAAHEISDIHRRLGHARLAWRYHLRSLCEPWGLVAYALYTRRLLRIGGRGRSRSAASAPALDQ